MVFAKLSAGEFSHNQITSREGDVFAEPFLGDSLNIQGWEMAHMNLFEKDK